MAKKKPRTPGPEAVGPKPPGANGSEIPVAKVKVPRRTGVDGIKLSPRERVSLYSAARYLSTDVKKACKLKIPFLTYFKDPAVAKANPLLAFDEELQVEWEPGLTDGPTSARFAVVDFNADTGHLAPPAEWDEPNQRFTSGGKALTRESVDVVQFHQVSVWAVLQRALEFFEDADGLGRRIPWAFEGNRLMVVPHAGYGQNAFYDRQSKSLQFYYFTSEHGTVFTCLSTDIVNHEFGHAVLDGVRPYYNESTRVETGAFHEFMGDLTAILLSLRNNHFREQLTKGAGGEAKTEEILASIARQFGEAVNGTPYLRSALNEDKMSDVKGMTSTHRVSQVMTGAMFDLLREFIKSYKNDPDEDNENESAGRPQRVKSASQVLAFAAQRMQRVAVQPLDLLPPVDATFRDYALAVCRSQQLANPVDPNGYLGMMIKVFRDREIFDDGDVEMLTTSRYLYESLRLTVYHDVDEISRSRAAAYRFLDDNREDLLIPAFQDFVVADLYDANKSNRQGVRLPRQIILEYIWREDVPLDGPEFGEFNGRMTTMLCGGTLVIDDNGNVLAWARKPGTLDFGRPGRRGKIAENWKASAEEGRHRRDSFLKEIAAQIAAGRVGVAIGTEKGFLGTRMPPLVAERLDGAVTFRRSPHLHLSEDAQIQEEDAGGRPWELSC
ncbi:hypothetical protein EP7_005122 [Isosphaeraceae bacterium EP7]